MSNRAGISSMFTRYLLKIFTRVRSQSSHCKRASCAPSAKVAAERKAQSRSVPVVMVRV